MSRYQRPTDKLVKAEEVCGQALPVLPHYFIKSLSIFAETPPRGKSRTAALDNCKNIAG